MPLSLVHAAGEVVIMKLIAKLGKGACSHYYHTLQLMKRTQKYNKEEKRLMRRHISVLSKRTITVSKIVVYDI